MGIEKRRTFALVKRTKPKSCWRTICKRAVQTGKINLEIVKLFLKRGNSSVGRAQPCRKKR